MAIALSSVPAVYNVQENARQSLHFSCPTATFLYGICVELMFSTREPSYYSHFHNPINPCSVHCFAGATVCGMIPSVAGAGTIYSSLVLGFLLRSYLSTFGRAECIVSTPVHIAERMECLPRTAYTRWFFYFLCIVPNVLHLVAHGSHKSECMAVGIDSTVLSLTPDGFKSRRRTEWVADHSSVCTLFIKLGNEVSTDIRMFRNCLCCPSAVRLSIRTFVTKFGESLKHHWLEAACRLVYTCIGILHGAYPGLSQVLKSLEGERHPSNYKVSNNSCVKNEKTWYKAWSSAVKQTSPRHEEQNERY